MSELYSVRVEAVDGVEVVLRVTTVHPDAGPPPDTATFAVEVLVELWSLLDRGLVGLIEGCELDGAAAQQLARDPAWAPRCKRLRELGFGRQVECTAEEHAALAAVMQAGQSTLFRGEPVGGLLGYGEQSYVFIPADRVALAAAVAPLVAAHGVDEREFDAAYEDWPDEPEQLPRARVHLRVHDAGWLGFVRPGWSWDTGAH
ncbi:hypothetical protein [Nannocystis bainbridge]|uniref:Uncharacterized protein n=1 Tax=Nannocystis bainbridge TaxID=2995303 RepID=A0ABT5E3G7_9BACT|nr:hypothetical protein [Nannocystis bainbridge]MDC0719859.1 hypothetical protein [Nannocystis bainbridge]